MNANQLQAMIDHFAREVGNSLAAIAPKTFAIMVAVKQADSIGALVSSGAYVALSVLFGSAAIALALAVHSYRTGDKRCDSGEASGREVAMFIIGLVVAVVCAIIAIGSFAGLSDYWTWIGAFKPDLAVYHDLITTALGNGK